MKVTVGLLLGLMVAVGVGCGSVPTSLLLDDAAGSLNVAVDGQVDTDLNVFVDTTVVGDVTCTIECNLNTGECDTVCVLDDGLPPTPEELGEDLYLANCSACHGDPVGTGFAPDISGESAQEIADKFDSGSHPGGTFPNLTMEDIDNIAAFLAV